MNNNPLSNTVSIRTNVDDLWRALTDPDLSVQYVGARVESTWRPGDEIVYLSPDRAPRLVEGTLLEVLPKKRFIFEGRLVFDVELAIDKPHREVFEIEDVGSGSCTCSSLKSLWRLVTRYSSAEPGQQRRFSERAMQRYMLLLVGADLDKRSGNPQLASAMLVGMQLVLPADRLAKRLGQRGIP